MQHHLMATLQEFEVLTTRINLEDIREKIAMFIVSQIIDQKGEFHKAVVYMHWNHMHRTLYGCGSLSVWFELLRICLIYLCDEHSSNNFCSY